MFRIIIKVLKVIPYSILEFSALTPPPRGHLSEVSSDTTYHGTIMRTTGTGKLITGGAGVYSGSYVERAMTLMI
jgi:hypothetical protein